MTVAQLITELSKLDPDLPVYVYSRNGRNKVSEINVGEDQIGSFASVENSSWCAVIS